MNWKSGLLFSLLFLALCCPSEGALAASKSVSMVIPAGSTSYTILYKRYLTDCLKFTKAGRTYVFGGRILKKNRFQRLNASRLKVLKAQRKLVSDPKAKKALSKKIKGLLLDQRQVDLLCLNATPGSNSSSSSSTSSTSSASSTSSLSSSTSSSAETGQVAQPAFNPNGGNFSGSVDVQISCATSGASIRYTVDGSVPSESNGTLIASGESIHLTSTTMLSALAYKDGMVNSDPASATFTVAPTGMSVIPAGEFQMGDPWVVEGDSNESPRHAVSLDQFFMDSYEVTNQQYADALNWALGQGGLIAVNSGVVYQAGTGTSYPYFNTTTNSAFSGITWDGSAFGVVSGKENHPVILVSWYGAVAYANWRSGMQGKPLNYDLSTWDCNWGSGYRLPTEAEWERAARGGAADHRFPWSDTNNIDHTRANYYSSGNPYYDVGTAGYDPAFSSGDMPYTSPVGYFPANDYGLYDMAGNAWEWCNDWYDGTYYSSSPSSNPRGPDTGTADTRVLRGGSWSSMALNQRCAYRSNGLPNYRAISNGFRLAISAE